MFKQLLAYLENHREVDYVIVYMRSRAFRNSVDAAITKRALALFGIRTVSCKEDFGVGYVAEAMEGVTDIFNELQVKQNGEDTRRKLRHKALNGGTISRAKLGYLNTRAEHESRLSTASASTTGAPRSCATHSSSTPPATTRSSGWLTHYLKGMLFCDRCRAIDRTSRLIYTEVKGRNGQSFGYFFCRARPEGDCDLPHLPAWHVAEAVRRNYTRLSVPDDFATAVRDKLDAAMADEQHLTRELHAHLTSQLAKLETREQRLIDLAADGVLDRGKIIDRQNAIQTERARIEASLADTSAELAAGAERLRHCIQLVADPCSLYAEAPDDTKR